MARPTHDEARLPKWVQTELHRLRSNEQYWKEKALEGPETSNTFLDHASEQKGLGEDPTIRFKMGNDPSPYSDSIRCRISKTHRGESYLDVNGGQVLCIRASASNSIRIFLEKH